MAKPRRGKNIKKIENWRGTCPVCFRKRVKLMWTVANEGQTVKGCKHCGSRTMTA